MILIVVETLIQVLIIIMMCMIIEQSVDFDHKTKQLDTDQYFKIVMANAAFGVVAVLITLMTSCQRIVAH